MQYILKDFYQFFENTGTTSVKAGKSLATIVMKNHARALGIGTKIGNAAVSNNLYATVSTIPDLINFYHNRQELFFEILHGCKSKYVFVDIKKLLLRYIHRHHGN